MSKKVGIYSGTFDPVHEGHIAFAEEAIERYGLDKVFFLVEPRPRRKQGVKAFEHRTEMVKLAIAKHPRLGQIVLEHARFTVHETLPLLKECFRGATLYMLMGEDMLNHLVSWPHVEGLADTDIIIGLRTGSVKTVKQLLKNFEKIRNFTPRYQVFKANFSDFSSTKIRASLRRGKMPDGLNPNVVSYIRQEGLYASVGE
jgi:nicotinate-nucleotide adenylyltransferase